ncbi:hypothetical protein ACWDRB_47615 [Nonomuraea sp. NPDC003707]
MSRAHPEARPPSKAVILAAVPRGMRRTPTQKAWLCTLQEHPEVLKLRCDAYTNLMRVATLICWSADWKSLCSRPTIAGIMNRTGLSHPTVKRWVRWLRHRGWLGVVEQGSIVEFRKGTLGGLADDGLGNRAAVWVLCIPRRPSEQQHRPPSGYGDRKSDPPSVSPPRGETDDPTRTREEHTRRFRDACRISPMWGLHATPGTKRDRLHACERLRGESPVLRRMSAWYLRWLLKPFFDAGATPADVLHGLDVRSDGSAWTYTWSSTNEIRHIPGWVRHRLSAWIGPDGRVLPLRSQHAAASAARRRTEQEAPAWSQAVMAEQKGLESPLLEPKPSRAEALAPPPAPAATRSGPNVAYRTARAEMERQQREKQAAIEAALARAR